MERLRLDSSYLKLPDKWHVASELFVNHKSKNSHLGSTSVVELNAALGTLLVSTPIRPAEVNSVSEVTWEFSSTFNIPHGEELKGTDEADNLLESLKRNFSKAFPSIADGAEGSSGVVNVTWEVDSSSGSDLPHEGKHGNTSVLELDETETVESFLVTIFHQTKRVEHAKRNLGADFALESAEGSSLGSRLGGGECSNRGDEGGEDSKLHG